eukprot:CAMPEP_0201492878 /NCGR_PEP_ID=MMETSP0151_2-20130828/35144_1 /ASSEMBLY_ACC=CAM_ASM_000257 /TAXON_ID=200890 /ORGANISM="Paramoeba atlantica, Strain 621/1 / CCAP 1560/9" /LENGTH=127 /DNA_ID=CAMNT_0047879947 /DNA_START=71 /DNA_END=454 /DNA_ORIENTATION=-
MTDSLDIDALDSEINTYRVVQDHLSRSFQSFQKVIQSNTPVLDEPCKEEWERAAQCYNKYSAERSQDSMSVDWEHSPDAKNSNLNTIKINLMKHCSSTIDDFERCVDKNEERVLEQLYDYSLKHSKA